MSSSVGRNSLIMASGTAASRVTGQIRTILLAAAIGTTGLAANAYQAGSQIPQVIFTLVSGGIFNAVLVPQIVRTLKAKDAEDRLNKLITFAIVLLLGVTLLMATATPLLTRLYVNSGDPGMIALTNAFTLWCMPQIFFYGLYTVVGQILAAKNHFATYAWSSVGANVISSAGFLVFILLFGKADRQPIDFWTNDKIILTAGTWTLGVAFQALILFLPLRKVGIHFKPSWGIKGIGLRAMGPVAAWSVGIVAVDQIAFIFNTRVMTNAPYRAHELFHMNQFEVPGNATYQNANTIYLLPYSLIAVSLATAVFPKISQAVANHDLSGARTDLSTSLRNVGLLMCFFTVAFLVMPEPITLALLPSVSMKEASFIAGPLMSLAVCLPLASAYLIIQRTFYSFEDGKHPFIFVVLQSGIQVLVLSIGQLFISPIYWATMLGAAISIGYALSFPLLVWMLRQRFNGSMDGKRITATYAKALIASGAALVGGLWLRGPAQRMVGIVPNGAPLDMNWFQAIGICVILTVVITVLYVGILWLLHTQELIDVMKSLTLRFAKHHAGNVDNTAVVLSQASTMHSDGGEQTPAVIHQAADARTTQGTEPVPAYPSGDDRIPQDPRRHSQQSNMTAPSAQDADTAHHSSFKHTSTQPTNHHASQALASDTPTSRMTTAPQLRSPMPRMGVENTMKPGLGDIVINRYTLMSQLREEPGLSAWKANDRILAHDCQVFIINNADALPHVNAIASSLALSRNPQFTQVLQLQHREDVAIIVTQLDDGEALSQYCQEDSSRTLSIEAMRAIVAGAAAAAMQLLNSDHETVALSTDTIRITSHGVQLSDAPISPLLDDPTSMLGAASGEQLATRQLAAVLYAMLTDTPSNDITGFDAKQLRFDTPEEFRLICERALGMGNSEGTTPIPLVTLAELTALLGNFVPLTSLQSDDINRPTARGNASVSLVHLRPINQDRLLALPQGISVTEEQLASQLSTNELHLGSNDTGLTNSALSNLNGSIPVKAEDALSEFGQPTQPWWDADIPRNAANRGGTNTSAGSEYENIGFRDIAASEMADIMAHDDPNTGYPLFPDASYDGDSSSFANQHVGVGHHQPTDGDDATIDANGATMQFDFSAMNMANPVGAVGDFSTDPLEATGRIPVIDNNGNIIAPGAESQRALEEEQAARDAAGSAALPPSFTPQPSSSSSSDQAYGEGSNDTNDTNDDDIADAKLFGGFTTKVVAIIAVVIIVIAALGLAIHGLTKQRSADGVTQSGSSQWPQMNLDDVPFGDESSSTTGTENDKSASSDASKTNDKSDTSSTPKKSKASDKITVNTADKNVKAVPTPNLPANTTAFDIDKQEFLTNPGGQRGYAYYMHLSQPQDAYKFIIKIRSSGGTGYLRANATNDPTQGEQVAQFSFDASGTTEVTFTKQVTSQDFLLWVPIDALPNNQLYIDSVQLF